VNSGLAQSLETLLAERPPARAGAVEELFGLSSYASRVDHLLASFDTTLDGTSTARPVQIQEKMRAAFVRGECVRLLFD